MKLFEIKGFWGLTNFILLAALILALVTLIPISLTLVAWNALIGEVLEGPMIDFWQAAILTAAMALGAHLVFKPHIEFQIKRAASLDDLEDSLKKSLNKKDSDNKPKQS